MNYRLIVHFSINNDERDQPHPTMEEIGAAVYEGRIAPEGLLLNITDLQVDVY